VNVTPSFELNYLNSWLRTNIHVDVTPGGVTLSFELKCLNTWLRINVYVNVTPSFEYAW
jgi:hypothetical protein